jgi:hypothetical protein
MRRTSVKKNRKGNRGGEDESLTRKAESINKTKNAYVPVRFEYTSKQISLMLRHPHLRVSSRPTEDSRSCSRRRRFASLRRNDKSFDGSAGPSKMQSRMSHQKEASGANARVN